MWFKFNHYDKRVTIIIIITTTNIIVIIAANIFVTSVKQKSSLLFLQYFIQCWHRYNKLHWHFCSHSSQVTNFCLYYLLLFQQESLCSNDFGKILSTIKTEQNGGNNNFKTRCCIHVFYNLLGWANNYLHTWVIHELFIGK